MTWFAAAVLLAGVILAARGELERRAGIRAQHALRAAGHDLAVTRAELEACRDTRRQLAADRDELRRVRQLEATRRAP